MLGLPYRWGQHIPKLTEHTPVAPAAIVRCLYGAAGKPETWSKLDAVRALLQAHLSDEELHYVMVYSGWAVLDVIEPSEQIDQMDLPFWS
jgi:hypothetical protein